jgi:hypothetical protein
MAISNRKCDVLTLPGACKTLPFAKSPVWFVLKIGRKDEKWEKPEKMTIISAIWLQCKDLGMIHRSKLVLLMSMRDVRSALNSVYELFDNIVSS